MIASSLFVGTVAHVRLRPRKHSFKYRVFYLFVDVDRLDALDARLRFFSHNRFNLFSIHDGDHGADDRSPLGQWARSRIAEAGIDLSGGSIRLLAYPRVLGYVFNPLSVWYCYDESGALAALIYEVRNTFGDKHSYVVAVDGDTSPLVHDVDKHLHVSPFMDMNQTYSFSVRPPDEALSLAITQRDSEGAIFRAVLRGSRSELSDRNLAKVFFSHPLVTIKTIMGIHWHAMFLWLKRVGFRRRPPAPSEPVTVVQSRKVEV